MTPFGEFVGYWALAMITVCCVLLLWEAYRK